MANSSGAGASLPLLSTIAVASLLMVHASASMVTTPGGTIDEATTGRILLESEGDETPEGESPDDEALAPSAVMNLPDCEYAAELHTVAPCEDDDSISCVTRTCAPGDFLYIVCTVPDDWEANGPEPPIEDCVMMATAEAPTAEAPEATVTSGEYEEHVGVDYIPAQPLGPMNYFNVTSNEVEVTDTCYGLVGSKEECQMQCDMQAGCNGAAWLSEPADLGEGWPFANCFLKELADSCALPGDAFTGPMVDTVTLNLKCEPTAADAALKAPMCLEVEDFEAALAPAMGPIAEGPITAGTRAFPGGAEGPSDDGDVTVGSAESDESAESDAAPAGFGTTAAMLVGACAAAVAAVAVV